MSCSARRRKRRGSRRGSVKRRGAQSGSAYGRNSDCLKSRERGSVKRDMSGEDGRNGRDTGSVIVTGTATGIVIGIATETGTEIETATVTETETDIATAIATGTGTEIGTAIATGIAIVTVLAVTTEVSHRVIATREESVPRRRRSRLPLLQRRWTTRLWKKPLCRCF